MKTLIKNYTFSAAGKTITFNDYATVNLNRILLVTNTVTNLIIYNFVDSSRGGSVVGNVLTLDYNTTSMSDADALQIFYEDAGLFTTRIAANSTVSTIEYIGKAAIGTATSAGKWQIQRLDSTTGTIILWADGNENFDNIWDNRESLTYS